MNEEEVTLLAVALAGEDTYWFCRPVGGRHLPSVWKNCTCEWLYQVNSDDIRSVIPWYRGCLKSVLKLGVGESSRVERFAVINDSVKAKKVVVGDGSATSTFFILENKERELLDARFEDFLKREVSSISTDGASNVVYQQTPEEKRHLNVSRLLERSNGAQRGNDEAFSWKSLYIVEYGNRVFYVCPSPRGNKAGYKVERIVRKGVTIFLLFKDETVSLCRVGETQEGERVTASSVLDDGEGKVMVMMIETRGMVVGTRRRNSVDYFDSEPPTKTARRESLSTDSQQWRPLRATGVNVWIEHGGNTEGLVNLINSFSFTGDCGKPMRTTVFPDGISVTYNAATAAKYAGRKKVTSTPTESDMVGLLENIQLAKDQLNAI